MYIKDRIFSLVFKTFICAAVIFGVLMQCGVGTSGFSFQSVKMFTTLSNIAVLAYFLCDIIMLIKNDFEESSYCVNFKFAITIAIMLTGLVAHFMLRKMFVGMPSQMKTGLIFLHYVVPIATLADWILFDKKGSLKKSSPFFTLIFPAAYVAFSMIGAQFGLFTQEGMGQNASRYPYPFMDVDKLGGGNVALIIIGMALALLLISYIGYFIDCALSKAGKKEKSEQIVK